jgi:hypothetical protein
MYSTNIWIHYINTICVLKILLISNMEDKIGGTCNMNKRDDKYVYRILYARNLERNNISETKKWL